MALLESGDVRLLQGVLKTPKSTPKEMLYLELGITPFSEIILKKDYYFYITFKARTKIQ